MAIRALAKALKLEPVEDVNDGKPPSLIEAIEHSLRSRGDIRGYLRPSALWKCKRQNVFLLGRSPTSPQTKDGRMERILDVGTATHAVVQKYLSDNPEFWFAPESRVYADVCGVLVKGSCDGIMTRRSDGYRFGIEIKTKKHDALSKLVKPEPEHVLQASLYAALHKVKWITVLYWDKDQQYMREFPVKFDKERWAKIKERISMLKAMAQSAVGQDKPIHWKNFLKDRLPPFEQRECDESFCPYWEFCRGMR